MRAGYSPLRITHAKAWLALILPLVALALILTAHDSFAARRKAPAAPLLLEGYTDDPSAAEETQPAQPAPPAAKTARPSSPESDSQAPPPAASGGAAKPIRLFGTVEFRSPIKNLPKWERVRGSEAKKPSFIEGGMDVKNADVSTRWKALREQLIGKPLMEQMKGVNKFFNQWPYRTDLVVWGLEDYWAVPREFVQKSGDCEDYAIAKYYALRNLGVSHSLLRVAAVKDSIRGLGHAILVVFVDGEAYILDNLTNLVLPHSRLKHYKPQYSVNEEFLWRHIQPSNKPPG